MYRTGIKETLPSLLTTISAWFRDTLVSAVGVKFPLPTVVFPILNNINNNDYIFQYAIFNSLTEEESEQGTNLIPSIFILVRYHIKYNQFKGLQILPRLCVI